MEAESERTPDEQVYQDNKQEPAAKVVYSNDPTSPTEGAEQLTSDVVAAANNDKMSADSFPASDPPSTPVALPKKPAPQSEQ